MYEPENELGPEGVRKLAPGLKELKGLAELNLSRKFFRVFSLWIIGCDDTRDCTHNLKHGHSGTKKPNACPVLHEPDNRADAESARELAHALGELKRLTALNLCGRFFNKIGFPNGSWDLMVHGLVPTIRWCSAWLLQLVLVFERV